MGILLEGQPQSRIEAAAVLAKLTGEHGVMQALCDAPGTFPAIVALLPLSSPQAAEAAATLVYRISLERPYRAVLGGTGDCINELTSVLDKATGTAKAMAGPGLLNLMENGDNQARLVEATNALNVLLRLGEQSLSHVVRRSAVGALRQVVDAPPRPPPPPRTNRTRRVLHPVLIGQDRSSTASAASRPCASSAASTASHSARWPFVQRRGRGVKRLTTPRQASLAARAPWGRGGLRARACVCVCVCVCVCGGRDVSGEWCGARIGCKAAQDVKKLSKPLAARRARSAAPLTAWHPPRRPGGRRRTRG
jgi:hypothetical protein